MVLHLCQFLTQLLMLVVEFSISIWILHLALGCVLSCGVVVTPTAFLLNPHPLMVGRFNVPKQAEQASIPKWGIET